MHHCVKLTEWIKTEHAITFLLPLLHCICFILVVKLNEVNTVRKINKLQATLIISSSFQRFASFLKEKKKESLGRNKGYLNF